MPVWAYGIKIYGTDDTILPPWYVLKLALHTDLKFKITSPNI